MIVDNRYGVFHAKNNGDVNKTSLGMLVSRKPIQIKDKSTNIVLLLSSKDGHEHLNGIVEFSKIFEADNSISEVIKCRNSEEVYKFIMKKRK